MHMNIHATTHILCLFCQFPGEAVSAARKARAREFERERAAKRWAKHKRAKGHFVPFFFALLRHFTATQRLPSLAGAGENENRRRASEPPGGRLKPGEIGLETTNIKTQNTSQSVTRRGENLNKKEG